MSWMTSRYSCSILPRSSPVSRCEPHLENRVRLDLRELERAHEPGARGVDVLGCADQRDHLIEVVERDLESFEDVGALLRLGEIVLGAPADDFAARDDVLIDQAAQREHLRAVVHEPEHDRAERRLERRVHEQLVQHDLRVRVLLELDDDAHAVAVGLVAQVADADDLAFAHEVGDAARAATALLTWNGISVATRLMRPPRPSSTCTCARTRMSPRPVM